MFLSSETAETDTTGTTGPAPSSTSGCYAVTKRRGERGGFDFDYDSDNEVGMDTKQNERSVSDEPYESD